MRGWIYEIGATKHTLLHGDGFALQPPRDSVVVLDPMFGGFPFEAVARWIGRPLLLLYCGTDLHTIVTYLETASRKRPWHLQCSFAVKRRRHNLRRTQFYPACCHYEALIFSTPGRPRWSKHKPFVPSLLHEQSKSRFAYGKDPWILTELLAGFPQRTVFDPMAGYFASAVAARALGKNFVGAEIDRQVFDAGVAEYERLTE